MGGKRDSAVLIVEVSKHIASVGIAHHPPLVQQEQTGHAAQAVVCLAKCVDSCVVIFAWTAGPARIVQVYLNKKTCPEDQTEVCIPRTLDWFNEFWGQYVSFRH